MNAVIDTKMLGQQLREAREHHGPDKGLSLRELSLVTGISETAIRSYELGDRHPTLQNMWRLSVALGIDLNDLRRKTLISGADTPEISEETPSQ